MTQTPQITKVTVVPVAGQDSMLLNLSGAHGPYFTRNIVLIDDSAGHQGLGEVPGGEKIRAEIERLGQQLIGQPIGQMNELLERCRRATHGDTEDRRGTQTFDLRTGVHVVTALESALLDLLGQHLDVPVAALLADGRQREKVEALGYLFYIGDASKTTLGYRQEDSADDEWFRLRNKKAMTADAVVCLAQAAQARYGFRHFKLKGGVLAGDAEIETVTALAEHFPDGIALDSAYLSPAVVDQVWLPSPLVPPLPPPPLLQHPPCRHPLCLVACSCIATPAGPGCICTDLLRAPLLV